MLDGFHVFICLKRSRDYLESQATQNNGLFSPKALRNYGKVGYKLWSTGFLDRPLWFKRFRFNVNRVDMAQRFKVRVEALRAEGLGMVFCSIRQGLLSP